MQDPRSRNQIFSTVTPRSYLTDYLASIEKGFNSINSVTIDALCSILCDTAKNGRQVFIAGNGGSASIANHLSCDWTKGTHTEGQPTLKTMSLVANEAMMTALANDFGYEFVFSKQIELLCQRGDALILISSSGESRNILEAARVAKTLGVFTVGMMGFSGGSLIHQVDLPIHIPISNYGVVEDCHQILVHVVAQYLAAIWEQSSEKDQAA